MLNFQVFYNEILITCISFCHNYNIYICWVFLYVTWQFILITSIVIIIIAFSEELTPLNWCTQVDIGSSLLLELKLYTYLYKYSSSGYFHAQSFFSNLSGRVPKGSVFSSFLFSVYFNLCELASDSLRKLGRIIWLLLAFLAQLVG